MIAIKRFVRRIIPFIITIALGIGLIPNFTIAAEVVDGRLEIPEGTTKVTSAYSFERSDDCQDGFYYSGISTLESVSIPASVRIIDKKAFYQANKLSKVTIQNGLQEIRTQAFEFCTSLESIVLPDSVQSIGYRAFRQSGLTGITLSSGLKIIEMGAFGTTRLKNVVIPNGCQFIGSGAFANCEELTDITIPPSVSGLDDAIVMYEYQVNPNLTIHGAVGSAAEKYAKNKGIKFNAVEFPEYVEPPAPQSAVPVEQLLSEAKSAAESKYNIKVNFGSEYSEYDNLKYALGLDVHFSYIPTELHNAVVAHFKSQGKTLIIDFDGAKIPGIYGEYNPLSVTITMGLHSTNTFLHEYGHMLHQVIDEKYGSVRFTNEWSVLVDYEGNISEDIAETYEWAEGLEDVRRYNKAGGNEALYGYERFILLDKIASSALNINSIFLPYTSPQTPSSWAAEAVSRAFPEESNGVLGKAFNDPLLYQENISRAEFCDLIVKMLDNAAEKKFGKRLIASDGVFQRRMLLDVNTGEYNYTGDLKKFPDFDIYTSESDNVAIATYYGIINGVSETRFAPLSHLTREQAAVILQRACKLLGLSDAGESVPEPADTTSISSWAADGVTYAIRNSIMTGTGGGNFSPQDTYSFEQAIVTLVRIYDSVPEV